MNILGIGPLELLMIFVIILLVLGPKDMVKTGKSIGSFIRKVSTSDFWKVLTQARSELTTLPNKLAREAGIEEIGKEIKEIQNFSDDLKINKIGNPLDSWTSPPAKVPTIDPPIDSKSNEISNDPETIEKGDE